MKKKIIKLIVKIIAIEACYFVLFFVIFGLSRTANNNMYPNINPGDLAFYYHLDKGCETGDIVAVKNGKKRDFYRVIACGGDKVEISKSGDLIVNGMSLDFDRVFAGSSVDIDGNILGAINYPYTVPENSFFLVGDNRDEVTDSRLRGAFAASEIDGKVISILRTREL